MYYSKGVKLIFAWMSDMESALQTKMRIVQSDGKSFIDSIYKNNFGNTRIMIKFGGYK
jgi:hypothetical protein